MTRRLTLDDLLNPRRPFHRRKRGWNPRRKRMGVIRKLRPFVTRSNRERASAVIRLKNRLRLERHIYGGRFVGSSDILDPERPALYKQDAHVFFLGTDKRVLWNAYIVTARKAFWGEIGSMASDRARALMPKEEKPWDISDCFEPTSFNAWGQATTYRMCERNETYEVFGGLTLREYKAKLEKEIITNEPPEIFESFAIDRGYEYGIGLNMVIDVELIDRETVERVIDRFLELGETNWRADSPAPRDRLPFETEMDALMTISPDKR